MVGRAIAPLQLHAYLFLEMSNKHAPYAAPALLLEGVPHCRTVAELRFLRCAKKGGGGDERNVARGDEGSRSGVFLPSLLILRLLLFTAHAHAYKRAPCK